MTERTAEQGLPEMDPMDAYLDGLMSASDRTAFERRIAEDAAARAEVRLQQAIDASLEASFACPSPDGVLGRIGASARGSARTAPQAVRVFGVYRRLGVAAAVVAAVVGLWRFGFLTPSGAPDDARTGVVVAGRFDVAYREIDISGRHPVWVCKDDAEFIGTFVKQFGAGLVLRSVPEDVVALGLSYSDRISKDTVVLLAEVDGELVLVFVDRADADAGFSASPGGRLRYFRKELGEFVLYEVTTLDRPRVLDLFREANLP